MVILSPDLECNLEGWGGVGVCVYIYLSIYMKVKVLITQWCPTLCDSMDYSPPDSSIHGIL